MIERKLNQIKEEFTGFTPPKGFAGGCQKSFINGFCVHLSPVGIVGKIEENCDHYDTCRKGYKFRYNA